MRNKFALFSVVISFFIAFIFLIFVSLESHNRGIQLKEVQMQEYINSMKEMASLEDITEYTQKITQENKGEILLILDNKYQVIYTNTFEKQTKDLLEYAKMKDNILKEESTRDLIEIENLNLDFIRSEKLLDNYRFVGAYDTDSMLKVTSHYLPYFFLSGAMGSLLLYVIFLCIKEKTQSETRYLIRSFKKFVREPELRMDYSPFTEIFAQDIQREAGDVRRRIENLESRLNGLTDMIVNMTEGVILVGKDRKILSVNEAAIKLVDASIHINYQGKDLLYLCRDMIFYKAFSNAFDQSKTAIKKVQLGEKIVKIYFNPVFTVEREFYGMMLLLIDETSLTISEQQRREFTSNVTHELKTPLTSIKGYTELLRSGSVPKEDENKFLDIILSESQRLFELIDAIISMSSLDERNKKEEYEIVDIYKITKDLVEAHKSEIEEKKLEVSISPSINNQLYTHPVLMKELLWNLFNNAVSYNMKEGSIKIALMNNPDFFQIEITDTGIGISYDDQNRIFERFYMVDKSRSYNKKSTGLGLAIVKHNVENLEGKIEVKSQINQGTKFILKFPKNELRASQ